MALSVALLLGGCAELNGLFNTQDAPPETEVRAGTFDPALATPAEDETFAAQPRNKPIPPKPDATAHTADAPVFDPLPPLPDGDPIYRHTAEGPDDMAAHVKGALTQTHLQIPVMRGTPALGTWQGIYLFEHRTRPRPREVVLHLTGTP